MTAVEDRLILEAIITTVMPDDSMHVAPMGPEVDRGLQVWTLKPFQSSTTFANMQRSGRCVVHVVDDSLLIAEAVLGQANHYAAQRSHNLDFVLDAACHWYALRVVEWDTSQPRAIARCEVDDTGVRRLFFGWNRAKHAVVEMAILASRIHILEYSVVEAEIQRCRTLIDKTAGKQEQQAFDLLVDFIAQWKRT
jgi:hypothetical protein